MSNVIEYGRFENTAGISVLWDLNKAVLTFGYDHYTFISTSEPSPISIAMPRTEFQCLLRVHLHDWGRLGDLCRLQLLQTRRPE